MGVEAGLFRSRGQAGVQLGPGGQQQEVVPYFPPPFEMNYFFLDIDKGGRPVNHPNPQPAEVGGVPEQPAPLPRTYGQEGEGSPVVKGFLLFDQDYFVGPVQEAP